MKKRTKGILITALLLIFALGAGTILGALTWIIQDTPDISDYKGSSEATLIYSSDGELLTKLFKENRVYVPLERIPQNLKNAIIAIEDTNFYVHHGIDFWGIGRAMITNIMQGRLAQGASTITQQLARNAFLTLDKTFYRKIQEAYLAVQFERLYTKSEILEMYLNEIFLGHSAYGVETASQQYFGKSVWELDLAESALIAGLPQSPNNYSPLNDPERAVQRRNVVLDRMEELEYITSQEAERARNAELELNDGSESSKQLAHYFILYVRDQLLDQFGASMVYSGGLKVYTTIDTKMQKTAEDRVNAKLENGYIPSFRSEGTEKLQPQIAVVSLDVNNGAIRTMIGGRGNDQFNRAYQAVRQPGSAFKPFVYAAGIVNDDITTGSIVNDLPMLASESGKDNLNIWPRNYADRYRGLITLNTALTHSVNIAAVKTIQKVGVAETVDLSEELGISTFTKEDGLDDHYSLALGGLNQGVTPLEMAAAYSVFANNGVYTEPYAITSVYDKNENLIYEAKPKKRIVMSEADSYLITSMLQSVVNNGTGRRAQMDRDVAGKTGTTNDYSDAWFVGFTPQLATSVWIGEDTRRSMEYDNSKTVSSGEAAQIWGEYMREAVKDMPKIDFMVPENIVEAPVEPYTGLKPNQYSPRIEVLPFKEGTEPTEVESLHGPVETLKVDSKTGLLATPSCPEDQVEERYYIQGSDIRIGPAEKSFREVNQNKDKEDLVSGSYSIAPGEPVQQIDHEYGIPKVNRNGSVRYETRPLRSCNVHQGSSAADDTADDANTDDEAEEDEGQFGSIFDIFGD